MYNVDFSDKAKKSLKKITPVNRKLIFSKLQILAQDPFRQLNSYTALKGTKDVFRLRAGNYRVIYTVNDTELIIFVIDIDHRNKIYKK